MATQQKVNNNLILAILTTICCCWPLGIPAIVFAARVNGLLSEGNYDAAVENANKAKRWAIIAAIAGIALWLIVIIVWVVMIVLGVATTSFETY